MGFWYKKIKSYYEKGYYTKDDVYVFVPKFLTEDEYILITE